MSRFLLNFVLPFLAPLLLFVGWAWLTRHRAAGGLVERLQKGPWFWLSLCGLLLVIAGLVMVALFTGAEPGSRIIPPRFEDGRVVPSQIE